MNGEGRLRSDSELADAARAGDRAAFAELWHRHSAAGLRAASSLTRTFDAEDLVAEAYEKILATMMRGGGPTGPFRPYLFVTIRSVAIGWAKKRREVTLNESEAEEIADPRATDAAVLAAVDANLTVRAFRTLPSRWQEVLWFTEVDALPTHEVATRLQMTTNAVAMLALRAREGLRQAWIQAHIDSARAGSEHRWVLEHVGQHARGKLRARARQRFDVHLAECVACTVIAADAVDTSNRFTTMLVPLAAGLTGAAGVGTFLRSQAVSGGVNSSVTPRAAHVKTVPRRLLIIGSASAAVVLLIAGFSAASIRHDTHRAASTTTPSPTGEPARPSASASTERQKPSEPAKPSTPAPDPVQPETAPPQAPEPDSRGDSAIPAPVQAVTAPTITNIDTGEGELLPVVSGTAAPGALVTVRYESGAAAVTAGSDGRWISDALPTVAGTSTVTAAADGATSEAQSFTVQTPEVFVSIAGSEASVSIKGTPGASYALALTASTSSLVTADDEGSVNTTLTLSGEQQYLVVRAAQGDRTGPDVRLFLART